MNNIITIKLRYFLGSLQQWREVDLAPQEYFDADMLEKGESFQIDSIPLYDDLIDYFFLSVSKDITKICAEVQDASSFNKITLFQNFWNDQHNWHMERKDYEKNKVIYRSLITVLQISDTPRVTEIIRAVEKDGFLEPEYHGIFTDNDDGSQHEKIVFPV